MKGIGKIMRSKKRRFFAASILVLLLAFGAWRQWVNAMPEAEIPTRQTPQHNAFDIYVAAGKFLAQRQLIGSAAEDTMPIPRPDGDIPDKTRPCTSADRLSILAGNSTTFTLFREGQKFKYVEPVNRSLFAQFPYYSAFRDMAYLLVVQGREQEHRQDWKGAAKTYLDCINFGAAARDNSFNLYGWLSAPPGESLGRAGLWRVIGRLDKQGLRAALAQLQQREYSRPALEHFFREESLSGQYYLLEIFQDRDWAQRVSLQFEGIDTVTTDWWKIVRLQFIGKRGYFDDYVRAMKIATEDTKLPYTKRHPLGDVNSISYSHQPYRTRFYFVDARSRADHNLLLVAVALRLFKLEQNRYPQNLNQLIPRYVNKVPADPYGGGEPLYYKLSGSEYSLYSVGPDGADNRGRAIEDKAKDRRQRFTITQESKGDVVAGVNH